MDARIDLQWKSRTSSCCQTNYIRSHPLSLPCHRKVCCCISKIMNIENLNSGDVLMKTNVGSSSFISFWHPGPKVKFFLIANISWLNHVWKTFSSLPCDKSSVWNIKISYNASCTIYSFWEAIPYRKRLKISNPFFSIVLVGEWLKFLPTKN